jgi:hypothetical protein
MLTSFILDRHDLDKGGFIVSWDLQTGGVISAIEWKGPRDDKAERAHITYLTNGRMVAALAQYQFFTTISIYDVVSGIYMYDIDHRARADPNLELGTSYVYKIWTHGESLQFAASEPTGIIIWEVGLTPGATPMEVENVPIPHNIVEMFPSKSKKQADIARTEFHPASRRLAFIGTGGTLRVWDTRTSEFLLQHTGVGFLGSLTFSLDGRFIACGTVGSEVYLWKESPTGYALFEKIATGTQRSEPRLSSNGESIITFNGRMIKLWHTKSFTSTTSTAPSRPPQPTESFFLQFLSDRPLAIIARRKGKTMTILNTRSGACQTIHTPIEIYGLRPIENVIVVRGVKKDITWNLGAPDHTEIVADVEDGSSGYH